MSRIITPRDAQGLAMAGKEEDGFMARVAKFVPAEIIAAYLFLQGSLVAATPDDIDLRKTLLTVAVVGLFAFTPLYIRRAAIKDGKPWIKQAIVCSAAFLVWVYALAIFAQTWGFYQAGISALLLVFFTIGSGFIIPKVGER